MDKDHKSIELCIPSKLGFEKIVAECVLTIAREMNFRLSKLQDLKTAVIEACLNAIEHGNQMDQTIQVPVTITPTEKSLIIEIRDNGEGMLDDLSAPDIKKKINGHERNRGLGLFLIKNLMDEVEIKSTPGKGHMLKIVLYLKP